MNGKSLFHSVELKDDSCKGCTVCVTSCPVEAIRVHKGKAHIREEQCIDCGECIRRCPNRAKYARTNSLSELENFEYKIALVAPAFYAQFNEKYSRAQIEKAIGSIGFDQVYDVSDFAGIVTELSAEFMERNRFEMQVEKPIISSSCPTILKLIQIRFPSLIEHILPIIPPSEFAAIYARKNAPKDRNTGIFFISPCPSKVTLVRSPLGFEKSEVDGVFSTSELYLPVLQAVGKFAVADENLEKEEKQDETEPKNQVKERLPSFTWCSASGEAICLEHELKQVGLDCKWINASGIRQAVEILEEAEDGLYGQFDFLEISACEGGCLGGPLTVIPSPVAEATLRRTKKYKSINIEKPSLDEVVFSKEIFPRPTRILDPDFAKARRMLESMENIYKQLGGLDCGSCGSPSCRALAEDIVKGKAKKEDCIIVLKALYEQMIFGD